MKKFLDGVMQWKTYACFMFTGSVIIYMILALCMGDSLVSLSTLFSLLIVSAVGTLIQFVAFSEVVIKKMRYSLRMIVFCVPFLAMLIICALCYGWFPVNYAYSWIVFVGIFLVVLGGMTLGFEIYFRITGKKYDGFLGQYKKAKEEKKKLQQ